MIYRINRTSSLLLAARARMICSPSNSGKKNAVTNFIHMILKWSWRAQKRWQCRKRIWPRSFSGCSRDEYKLLYSSHRCAHVLLPTVFSVNSSNEEFPSAATSETDTLTFTTAVQSFLCFALYVCAAAVWLCPQFMQTPNTHHARLIPPLSLCINLHHPSVSLLKCGFDPKTQWTQWVW